QTAKPTEYLLLSHDDMAEANTSVLPVKDTHTSLSAARCVIEILSDWGIAVPGDDDEDTSVKGWHDYSRTQGLDYRQDNNYIVIYVQKLGYPLINSTWTKWSDWKPAAGRYLVTSSSSPGPGVGHMIGVTVARSGAKTITDRQELSPGMGTTPDDFSRFHVRY